MDDKRVAEIDARWVKADLVLHVMTSDERQALSDIAYLLDALTTAQDRIATLEAGRHADRVAGLEEGAARAFCVKDGKDPDATDYKGKRQWQETPCINEAKMIVRLAIDADAAAREISNEEYERVAYIEGRVAEAKGRQDVKDSGLLAIIVASDIPYLLDALTTAQARIAELERQVVETALKAPPGHGSPCASCGEEIDAIAGNPSKWPTWIFADGAPQYYHVGCLAKRIATLEAGRHADRVALLEYTFNNHVWAGEFEGYDHDDTNDIIAAFDADAAAREISNGK